MKHAAGNYNASARPVWKSEYVRDEVDVNVTNLSASHAICITLASQDDVCDDVSSMLVLNVG